MVLLWNAAGTHSIPHRRRLQGQDPNNQQPRQGPDEAVTSHEKQREGARNYGKRDIKMNLSAFDFLNKDVV